STALIGREIDLAIVSERLGTADAHLVTLTGPGGIGKTRLAIQLAVDTSDQYPYGVYFVSLASVVDPALVPTVIAQVLRAPTNPGQTVLDDLKDFLRNRTVLLILDSFEPVLSAAPVVADL